MLRVLFVPLHDGDAEADAAWRWLAGAGFAAERAALTRLASALRGSAPDVVWIHSALPDAGPAAALEPVIEHAARAGLLLTGGAATLAHALGLETAAPNEAMRRAWRHADDELHLFKDFSSFPHIRGHAAFRAHPLFRGLGAGTYTWWAMEGEEYTVVAYRRPAWPERGRVVAVERSYIHVNPERATIWEYDVVESAAPGAPPAPRVLCIGAYLPLASTDPLFRAQADRLARNALWYAAGREEAGERDERRAARRPGWWLAREPRVREDASLALPAAPPLAEPLPPLHARPAATDADAAAPFTLAGRRGFAAGTLDGAATEAWLHPLRVLKALRVDAAFREAVITPAGVERRLDAAGRDVVEKLFIPLELPAAVLEWSAPDGADLRAEWVTDLRLTWPYPASALGGLRWRRDGRTVVVRADEPDDAAVFVFSREPDALEVDGGVEAGSPAVRVRLALRLAPGESVRLAVAATTEGDDDLAATLAALRSLPALVRARAGALARLSASTISVSAPDPLAAEAVEWAKARLDAFRVETPGVGRSLVAGYWTSRPGWNDGRPGYAWYFGRDAAWTALGSLAAGQFDAAAEVLRFLGEHQDVSGKILHECTTSGVAHYDAADSTPLYLLLAARYAAWTGDLGLLRRQWTRILAAYRFCLATDTDGDGLIENPRIGHGWIEFGRLGGGRVTFYNAGIWAAALGELVTVAEALGETAVAAELRERAARARIAIERRFHDATRGVYALKLDDGPDAAPDWTQTATHAVPLLLGAVPPERMRAWLDLVAGDGFTAPWGVRMVAHHEPDYRPESYHGGAVWPLYTGWTSWAEYAAGRSDAAFRHWWMNVEQVREREKGAWDEVLHGAERRGIGVCPDQAWSTAMVLAPLVYGLLGAEPDAPRHSLRLRPQPPAAWDRLDVERLRVGDAEVALRYRRDGARHTFIAEQTSGPVPLRLVLEPVLLARRLAAARVDGRDAQLDARPFGERLLVPVQLVLDHERSLEIHVEDDAADDTA